MKAFFISIPHSGEKIPAQADWLKNLDEKTLMCDVDRFVDELYAPAIQAVHLPSVVAEWHRYLVDLNRLPMDIDVDSVEGAPNASGQFTRGLHWVKTTTGATLMNQPISMKFHKEIVAEYFQPFHDQVEAMYADFHAKGFKEIYHLDAHSMPSMGTKAHRDPGAKRPEIVVSDVDGSSCRSEFKDLVIDSYKSAGFEVAYNWPYKGGRLTQTYGQPKLGHHAIQVEISRALYMDETTKQRKSDLIIGVQKKIENAIRRIHDQL
jgi:N-formylglutamate amidohydrolase